MALLDIDNNADVLQLKIGEIALEDALEVIESLLATDIDASSRYWLGSVVDGDSSIPRGNTVSENGPIVLRCFPECESEGYILDLLDFELIQPMEARNTFKLCIVEVGVNCKLNLNILLLLFLHCYEGIASDSRCGRRTGQNHQISSHTAPLRRLCSDIG